MFINTVVLRTAMSSTLTFQEYLKQVRNITLEAYEHQEIPFEKLVKELQPERDLSRNPLFQVTFNFHDAPMPNLELPELSVQLLEGLSNGSAKFDLSVIAIPRAEQHVGINQRVQTESITFLWEYNTDLFEEATIQRLLSHYQRVLEGIVAHPEQRLCELPLLSSVERQCLLHDWNATQIVLPTVLTIHEQIAQQAVRTPGAIAVVFQEERLSYAHLDQRANQLAHYLQSLGVGPEVRVSVCMERSLEMVIGLLGVLKAGGAYVPMDPDYPKERLAFLLEDAQAAVVLTQQHLLGHLPDVQQLMVCLDKQWEVISQQSTKMVSSEVGADHLAYVIYTSGSTGVPKGVMITHRAICNHMFWMQEAFSLTDTDRVLQKTSFGFDASVWEFYAPLLVGAQLVMAQPGGHQDCAYLVNAIQQYKITILQLVPSVLQLLLNEAGIETCTTLKHVFCGGEVLSVKLQEKFFDLLTCNYTTFMDLLRLVLM
jgi:non-ribosomal peptide synthetase component F